MHRVENGGGNVFSLRIIDTGIVLTHVLNLNLLVARLCIAFVPYNLCTVLQNKSHIKEIKPCCLIGIIYTCTN